MIRLGYISLAGISQSDTVCGGALFQFVPLMTMFTLMAWLNGACQGSPL